MWIASCRCSLRFWNPALFCPAYLFCQISIFLLDNRLSWCNLGVALAFFSLLGGSASVSQVPRATKMGLSRAANFSGHPKSQRRS